MLAAAGIELWDGRVRLTAVERLESGNTFVLFVCVESAED